MFMGRSHSFYINTVQLNGVYTCKPEAIGSTTDASFNSREASTNQPQIVVSGALQLAVTNNSADANQLNVPQIMMYPNPVKGTLNIKVPHAGGIIQFVDVYGRVVQQNTVTNTNVKVNLHGLSAGVYFINYNMDGKIINSQKIIVQ